MVGKFVGVFDNCMTDQHGDVVVSFKAESGAKYDAKQCAAAAQTALASGKYRLKIEVDIYREKRSLAANNYFWQLCDKIAQKIGSTKIDVYRQYVLEQGVFEQYEINEAAVDSFTEVWSSCGDGWLVEKMDYSERVGFVIIHAYKGSSTYDKGQMSRLIEGVVTDCKELEIETLTPQELALMVQRWEGSRV